MLLWTWQKRQLWRVDRQSRTGLICLVVVVVVVTACEHNSCECSRNNEPRCSAPVGQEPRKSRQSRILWRIRGHFHSRLRYPISFWFCVVCWLLGLLLKFLRQLTLSIWVVVYQITSLSRTVSCETTVGMFLSRTIILANIYNVVDLKQPCRRQSGQLCHNALKKRDLAWSKSLRIFIYKFY